MKKSSINQLEGTRPCQFLSKNDILVVPCCALSAACSCLFVPRGLPTHTTGFPYRYVGAVGVGDSKTKRVTRLCRFFVSCFFGQPRNRPLNGFSRRQKPRHLAMLSKIPGPNYVCAKGYSSVHQKSRYRVTFLSQSRRHTAREKLLFWPQM